MPRCGRAARKQRSRLGPEQQRTLWYSLNGEEVAYIDVHLLVSFALTLGARLWTRDARLRKSAEPLGCAYL